jgi:hypothetical protein
VSCSIVAISCCCIRQWAYISHRAHRNSAIGSKSSTCTSTLVRPRLRSISTAWLDVFLVVAAVPNDLDAMFVVVWGDKD